MNRIRIWFPALCVLCLLSLFAGLSIWEMSGDSLTVDERVHLPAGYAYWRTHDFRLNPEHPPFVKLLCAAPLLPIDPVLPSTAPPQGMDYRRFMGPFGVAFLFSQDADRLLFRGRLPVVGLGVLLGLLVFLWSWRLHGNPGAGLVSLALLALEPTILAHSHYVTTDVALACFGVMAFSFLWRFCERGGRSRDLVLACLGMGLALASKFSAMVFLPVFYLLWLLRWPKAPAGATAPSRLRGKWGAALLGAAGMAVIVQACYFFSPDLTLYFKGIREVLANKPEHYPAYINGSFRVGGTWWYPLYLFLLKTPLATLLVMSLAVAGLFKRAGGWKPILLFVALPGGLYAVAVCLLADNYGLRYLIPATSFLLVLAGRAYAPLAATWKGRAAAAVLAVWLVASVARTAPHFIAYCNEIIGGPENAAHFMGDSSIDWGQDLVRLKRYEDERGIDDLILAYWGPVAPNLYGVRYRHWTIGPRAGTDDPPLDADPPVPGIYAISVNHLIHLKKRVQFGRDDPKVDWLERFEPAGRVGYSIYIYDFRGSTGWSPIGSPGSARSDPPYR